MGVAGARSPCCCYSRSSPWVMPSPHITRLKVILDVVCRGRTCGAVAHAVRHMHAATAWPATGTVPHNGDPGNLGCYVQAECSLQCCLTITHRPRLLCRPRQRFQSSLKARSDDAIQHLVSGFKHTYAIILVAHTIIFFACRWLFPPPVAGQTALPLHCGWHP